MVAILTGDVTASTTGSPARWMKALKGVLNQYGKSPHDWEIYRGDSFQLRVDAPLGLSSALHIMSAVRAESQHQVRIGIGVGEETYRAQRITESNGPAYVHSGRVFDRLGHRLLSFGSDREQWNEGMDLLFRFAGHVIKSWTPIAAQVVWQAIEHPELNQTDLAALLGKSQSNVSATLKRAGFDLLSELNAYYQNLLH